MPTWANAKTGCRSRRRSSTSSSRFLAGSGTATTSCNRSKPSPVASWRSSDVMALIAREGRSRSLGIDARPRGAMSAEILGAASCRVASELRRPRASIAVVGCTFVVDKERSHDQPQLPRHQVFSGSNRPCVARPCRRARHFRSGVCRDRLFLGQAITGQIRRGEAH